MNIKKKYNLAYQPSEAGLVFNDSDILYYKQDTYNGVEGTYWFINGHNTGIKTTDEGFAPTTSFSQISDVNAATFNEQASILEQRINNIAQDLAYWDIYHIKTQVTEDDDVDAKFASLNPGESLVINNNSTIVYELASDSETSQTLSLKRGDVIIKTLDGDAIVIEALSQGVYYPSQIQLNENGQYTITYSFSTSMPSAGVSVVRNVSQGSSYNPNTDTQQRLAETISFNSISDNITNQPYNVSGEVDLNESDRITSFSFKQVFNNSQPILPVIKIFDKATREELYIPYTVTSTTDSNEERVWLVTLSFPLFNPCYYIAK